MVENIFKTLKNHVTNKATALTNIVTEADMSSVVSKDVINM